MNSFAPLIMLSLVMAASMAIGVMANRASEKGGFLKGFFLGNRGLGPWAMALTATIMSGGTFMGFPSLVYKQGWVLALWIASYMLVPLCTFAVLGKPLGKLGRRLGAITLPDLLQKRFQSPSLGIASSLVMIGILTVSMIAQFKGGAIILKEVLPGLISLDDRVPLIADKPAAFLLGLAIFTIVVTAYTVVGGFMAAVWTDLFQSVLMAIGILILFPLTLMAAGGLAHGTQAGMQAVGAGFISAPGASTDRQFLPLTMMISYFCMWSIAGMGQPATLVRLMAFRDTKTLRYAIVMLAIYNTIIYLPLVLTFIAARDVLPGLVKTDEVMPKLASAVASPWLAGLILAAPFGAVMATASSFLVQISSGIVEDIYHRKINPAADTDTLRRISAFSIVGLAIIVACGTIWSPEFLQAIIVFCGGASACAFLVPAVLAAYSSRANARSASAAMYGGIATVLVLYLVGWVSGIDQKLGASSKLAPYYLFGFEPFVWGLIVSALLGWIFLDRKGAVSLETAP
jgi:SSS family solute:Na+ symporter/sodium/pantothenate symporter